jgi:hypothetical protein
MKKVSVIFILTMAIAAFANAQATRTWVSGVGDDVNPCSRTAPCKTFAGAISKTAAGGIINCLDPGGFGAVTITKSMTIDCTGTFGSALSSGVQGVVVNTGLTTDKVVLRGIDINGAGTTLGTNGVQILQAGSVSLFDVHIANYSGQGIQTVNSSNQISVFVDNCEILNVNGTGILGASTGTGTTLLTVTNSFISGNSKGIDIESASSSAQVSNTVLSKNTSDGFKIGPGTSGGALESNNISFNGNGVNVATAGGTVRLARNTIHANFTNGITGLGATQCFGSNVITGNVGNNNCSSPLQAQQ